MRSRVTPSSDPISSSVLSSPVVQTVVEVEDLPLALGQVGLEHGFEEVAARDRLDVLLDVGAVPPAKRSPKLALSRSLRSIGASSESSLAATRTQRADGLDRLGHSSAIS
jgi:hypothetical protein